MVTQGFLCFLFFSILVHAQLKIQNIHQLRHFSGVAGALNLQIRDEPIPEEFLEAGVASNVEGEAPHVEGDCYLEYNAETDRIHFKDHLKYLKCFYSVMKMDQKITINFQTLLESLILDAIISNDANEEIDEMIQRIYETKLIDFDWKMAYAALKHQRIQLLSWMLNSNESGLASFLLREILRMDPFIPAQEFKNMLVSVNHWLKSYETVIVTAALFSRMDIIELLINNVEKRQQNNVIRSAIYLIRVRLSRKSSDKYIQYLKNKLN